MPQQFGAFGVGGYNPYQQQQQQAHLGEEGGLHSPSMQPVDQGEDKQQGLQQASNGNANHHVASPLSLPQQRTAEQE